MQPEIRLASNPTASFVNFILRFPTEQPKQKEERKIMSCGEGLDQISLIPGNQLRKKRIESIRGKKLQRGHPKKVTTVSGCFVGRGRGHRQTCLRST